MEDTQIEIQKYFNARVFRNNKSLQITIPPVTGEENNIKKGDIVYLRIIQVTTKKIIARSDVKKNGKPNR